MEMGTYAEREGKSLEGLEDESSKNGRLVRVLDDEDGRELDSYICADTSVCRDTGGQFSAGWPG